MKHLLLTLLLAATPLAAQTTADYRAYLIRFEGNTAYYSTCSDGWIGYRCLDGARYRDLDLGR